MAAIRISCLLHGVLLLLALGCAVHPPVNVPAPPDPEVASAHEFVAGVADKMPLWDADTIACYERWEIATVKADIAMAQLSKQRELYLQYANKLHQDWNALLALDERLKKESLT